MKIWKILILLTGLAGLVGFFLPMTKTAETSFSALDIMRAKTADNAVAITAEMKAVGESHGGDLSKKATEKLDASLDQGLNGLKGIIAALFVPALLLTIIGAAGMARGKLLRLGGITALLLGIVSAAIWGIFFLGAKDMQGMQIGLGLHMLLVAGIGGVVGGLGTIFKPDTGEGWTGV